MKPIIPNNTEEPRRNRGLSAGDFLFGMLIGVVMTSLAFSFFVSLQLVIGC